MNIESGLSRAVVQYVGYGTEKYPGEGGSRVIATLGKVAGTKLIPQVMQLLGEMGQCEPEWQHHTLESASEWASKKMKERYPELNEEALTAIAWVFTWWWR